MDVPIERVDGLPFGRAYKITKDGVTHFLPSVTTILKMNEDPFIQQLRDELGMEKFLHIQQRAADRGTVMHRWLEVFLENYQKNNDHEASLLITQKYIQSTTEFDNLKTEKKRAMKIGQSLFYNFYNQRFFSNIKKVLYNEIFMYTFFKGGWAGASDFIYEDFDDCLVVQDFKSASDIKDIDHIDNYKMQIACYMFMFAVMFGRVPDRGEIVIANEKNSNLQFVIVPQSEMKMHLKRFLGLMTEFRNTPEWLEFEQKLAVV